MKEEGRRWGAYGSVGRILRAGVFLSLVVLLMGLVLAGIGRGVAGVPPSIDQLPSGLASGEAGAFVSLGVLLLILTPVVRVLFTLYYFGKERDKVFTLLAFVVFLNLMIGFGLGLV